MIKFVFKSPVNLSAYIFLSFLFSCSGSGNDDVPTPSSNFVYQVSGDANLDPQNYYLYLRDSSGSCLVPENFVANCEQNSRAVTQLKYGPGFVGSVYGLRNEQPADVELDPEVQEIISIYSGSTATYSAKHSPVAVEYDGYTYFVYSGPALLDNSNTVVTTDNKGEASTSKQFLRSADNKSNALGIYLARYNHLTSKVSAPLLVHVKNTDDPHDNAVINFDDEGHLYILISGRSLSRSALLYVIDKPNSHSVFSSDFISLRNITFPNINYSSLDNIDITVPDFAGITYPKLLKIPGGFRLIFTLYCLKGVANECDATRQIWSARISYDAALSDSAIIDQVRPLAAFGGHYALSAVSSDGMSIVIAFNVLVDGSPGNRTNLYALLSNDAGENWGIINSSQGTIKSLESTLPIDSVRELNEALVYKQHDYNDRIVERLYLKDLSIRSVSQEIQINALVLTEQGIAGSRTPLITDSHLLGSVSLDASGWKFNAVSRDVDHNYSTGFIFKSESKVDRVYFPATPEPMNNALSGGAVGYADIGVDVSDTTYLTQIKEPGNANYLNDLCEINYIRQVANQHNDDFIGIGSATNPYHFQPDSVNPSLPASALYIFTANGELKRLPKKLSSSDELGEYSLELLEEGGYLNCDSGANKIVK